MKRLVIAFVLFGTVLVFGASAALAGTNASACPSGSHFDDNLHTLICNVPSNASVVAPNFNNDPPHLSAAPAAPSKMKIPTKSTVTTTVDLSAVKDPAQRKADEEFLKAAIAKEETYYAGKADAYVNFYADNVVSVQPETEEIDGKAALAASLKPYMQANRVVGNLTIKRIWVNGNQATRQAQWEEWTMPKDGSAGEHHIGRCTLNWEKINGEWKVTSEYINYLVPPTPFNQ